PNFEFGRSRIRHKLFTESRQCIESFEASPEKAHVRRKNFIAGADEVIAAKRLDIDRAMRAIVHGVNKDLCPGSMCDSRDLSNIENRTDGIRSQGTGDNPRSR